MPLVGAALGLLLAAWLAIAAVTGIAGKVIPNDDPVEEFAEAITFQVIELSPEAYEPQGFTPDSEVPPADQPAAAAPTAVATQAALNGPVHFYQLLTGDIRGEHGVCRYLVSEADKPLPSVNPVGLTARMDFSATEEAYQAELDKRLKLANPGGSCIPY